MLTNKVREYIVQPGLVSHLAQHCSEQQPYEMVCMHVQMRARRGCSWSAAFAETPRLPPAGCWASRAAKGLNLKVQVLHACKRSLPVLSVKTITTI